jgi:predicted ribosomally synthesized peptide with nif11-like leader
MSLEHVQAFYNRLANDEDFRTQIHNITSKDEYSQIVQTAGYDFTQQEFEEYTTQLLESNNSENEIRDLDEAELAVVAGGYVATLLPLMPILIYGLPGTLLNEWLKSGEL